MEIVPVSSSFVSGTEVKGALRGGTYASGGCQSPVDIEKTDSVLDRTLVQRRYHSYSSSHLYESVYPVICDCGGILETEDPSSTWP